MRCLTLAHQFAKQGAACSFLVEQGTLEAAPALGRSGFDVHLFGKTGETFDGAFGRVIPDRADLVIFDHYGLGREEELRVAPFARHILVIDDLANRPHYCDVLLDPTVGRDPSDYATLVDPDCQLLIGGDYALLRPEFSALALRAVARRSGGVGARRLLVSMGLTDLGGVTAAVVVPLAAAGRFDRIDVILTATSSSRREVERLAEADERLQLHLENADVAQLMTDADIAIGAAGTTSWERCCLGLPTIMLQLADNQAKVAKELAGRGAALLAENAEEAAHLTLRLADEPVRLTNMSERAARLIDGHGAARVAGHVSAWFRGGKGGKPRMCVRFRPATMDDAEMLFVWRNDPETRMQSIDGEEVGWEDHLRWLSAKLADPDCDLLIAVRGVPVGTVRIDRRLEGLKIASTLSWTVAPDARGRGYGKAIVRGAKPDGLVRAFVKRENLASQAIARAAGLRLVDDAPLQIWETQVASISSDP